MDFNECVEKRTSIRRFRQEPVSLSLLYQIIDHVRRAPSAANLQPIEYILINQSDICEKIFPCIGWAAYITPTWSPKEYERPTAYIALVNTQPKNPYVMFDIGISMAYITLSAQSLELSSCILCKINKKIIKKILKIPNQIDIEALIALGKKDEIVLREEYHNDVKYWRDKKGVFHVPKKSISQIIHKQYY